MNNGEIRSKVREFKEDSGLKKVNYSALCKAADGLGYTVIEFAQSENEENVRALIEALDLSLQIKTQRGFTFANDSYRLIFVNENLSNKEKEIVLAHELGHIVCGHMFGPPVIGKDVTDEYEANEFAHFLLSKRSHKPVFYIAEVACGAAAVVGVLFLISRQLPMASAEIIMHTTSSSVSDDGVQIMADDRQTQQLPTESEAVSSDPEQTLMQYTTEAAAAATERNKTKVQAATAAPTEHQEQSVAESISASEEASREEQDSLSRAISDFAEGAAADIASELGVDISMKSSFSGNKFIMKASYDEGALDEETSALRMQELLGRVADCCQEQGLTRLMLVLRVYEGSTMVDEWWQPVV